MIEKKETKEDSKGNQKISKVLDEDKKQTKEGKKKLVDDNELSPDNIEEKRENCNRGGRRETKVDSNKNGSYEGDKLIEKTCKLKAGVAKTTGNNKIVENTVNKYEFILAISPKISNIFPEKDNNNSDICVANKDISGNSLSYKQSKVNILQLNDNKKNYRKNNWKVNSFIIIFLIIFGISKESKQRMISSNSSIITIKIKGSGESNIFYEGDYCPQAEIFSPPAEVYINDTKQLDVKNKYNFEEPENTVKLVWYTAINICNCLFKDCININ